MEGNFRANRRNPLLPMIFQLGSDIYTRFKGKSHFHSTTL